MSMVPALADISRYGEEAIQAARHRDAIAALAASPLPGLLDAVEAVRKALLAVDPRALRRSVGWFGRLLGKDIALQAEADALRSQLGVHLVLVRGELAAAARHRVVLERSREALLDAAGALSRDASGLAEALAQAPPATAAVIAPRMRHLATMAASYQVTAGHIELTLLNHDDLLGRIERTLPRVEILLDQDRMLRDDRASQAALRSATEALEAVHALPPNRFTENTPAAETVVQIPRSTP